MGRYGLVGRHLGHSYSPAIHGYFGTYPYDLIELEPDALESFLRYGDWSGLNVTIPYKKTAAALCHTLSPMAQRLGSVNTLVRRPDGTIFGDNTDAFGFWQMALRLGVDYSGKKALVLGSGGASVTVQAILGELGAAVTVISRSGENNYTNLSRHMDAAIIVNTTPVGMYPNNGAAPLSLDIFPKIEAVLDLVYNPARTALILEAEKRGIACTSGLYMLVAQAALASQHFTGRTISPEMIGEVWTKLTMDTENLILIGMPGCGKSTIGRLLARILNRPFWDADDEIEKCCGRSAGTYIQQFGESAFRQLETDVLRRLGAMSGAVIATGGGCVTREENHPLLRQNGRILWLQRALGDLSREGRPLSQAAGVSTLYRVRKPLYQAFSQFTVSNDGSPEETVKTILEVIRP